MLMIFIWTLKKPTAFKFHGVLLPQILGCSPWWVYKYYMTLQILCHSLPPGKYTIRTDYVFRVHDYGRFYWGYIFLCWLIVPLEMWLWLTHWGRVTHIWVGTNTNIGSDNGLSPGQCQAITWTNARILLIGPLGTIFSGILSEIHTFSFKKMHFKTSSAK